MTHPQRVRPTQRDLRRHPHLSLVQGLKQYGAKRPTTPQLAPKVTVVNPWSIWKSALATALGTLLTAAVVAAALLVFTTVAKAETRDISQSQLDIQAPDLLFNTPGTNINADDRCAPFNILSSTNGLACSSEFAAYTPAKDMLVTKIVILVYGTAGDNGQCRLSLWTDDFTDGFATQAGSNMDFDASAAAGTTYTFNVNLSFDEFVPLGVYFEDDDQAGTCAAAVGNDPDVKVYFYGKFTN